ncbi:MAG: hypothetical protein Q7U73_10240 [Rubrivivax sp.]|nr:hypothetical protein [Rubrivivax sp.]
MNSTPDSPALQVDLLPHGALLRLQAHGVMLNLFPANLMEGGPANLWLRLHGPAGVQAVPLLGPNSPLQPRDTGGAVAWAAQGTWQGLALQLQLRVAATEAAWFWHLDVHNTAGTAQRIDLLAEQDVGLAPLGAIRLNEYYVSHYLDLSPLQHPQHGVLLAARQNQPVAGRFPWLVCGALHQADSYATDALQLLGLAQRNGSAPPALQHGLPGTRLQHEHALLALQHAVQDLLPGQNALFGSFGLALADHPAATSDADLAWVDTALRLPAAQPLALGPAAATELQPQPSPSLFASAPLLAVQDLAAEEIPHLFPGTQRHPEHDANGALLSFFHDDAAHVVLRAKEAAVMRPHGHLLRSGRHAVPDETALTSTAWMAGVFHSLVTQGHVGINQFISTVRGALGQFRAHGQRIFIDAGSGWQLLGVPSAFEMRPEACRWLYRHAGGLLEVRSAVQHAPHALTLDVRVLDGGPLKLRFSHHVTLGGDDGVTPATPLQLRAEGRGVFVSVPAGSALAERFPHGGFVIAPDETSAFTCWGGDEQLFADGRAQGQPWLVIDGHASPHFGLRIEGHLVTQAAPAALPLSAPQWQAPAGSTLAGASQRLQDIAPWYLHNALVHYLSPRGLEQFSGGGWGTRDVCQGPLEMLLALDEPAPVRDLLQRVFAAQDAGGDWPQWFMFFERERMLRAGDSHGDIVFWPLVGLARYLRVTGDAALLDERLPFFNDTPAPLWQHVERALAVVHGRRIADTALAAYGHGDWNDSLQPVDPALREHLCSAWTVTLHHQMLHGLATALDSVGQTERAAPLHAEAAAVHADFQRLLMRDGVVAGYMLFEPGQTPQPLLHPRDDRTGVHYSLLPMMHAVLEDLLTPAQAQTQAALIEQHLTGPDGARLFDHPLPYRGGPMQLFQRAESSAFFGREIGVMYMHAHLRWAEMLAHLGQAERFFHALQLAHPIALHTLVPQATRRQANCYYSSSDAAFPDRATAGRDYAQVARGEVALDGGWRVYSSGPGIALGLIVGSFLGLRRESGSIVLDPVLPHALAGLVARLPLLGFEIELELQPGAQGHGPTDVLLDGETLPFTREANPYRVGGARISLDLLRARLATGARRLVVHTG